MEKTKRPRGLTFFAIINFIIAAITIVVACSLILGVAFVDRIPVENLTETQRVGIDALKNMPASSIIFSITRAAMGGILLILAGIGYLKQKKGLGYLVGNIYVAAMIIFTVISPFMLKTVSQSVMSYVLDLIYPVITLIVINFIYRKNLNG